MRAFDYRVWHKKTKKMYEVKGWMQGDSGYCVYAVDEHGVTERFADGLVELMQYTGLVDKHGKRACEDDLVNMFGRSLFRIAWDGYSARFQLELVKGHELRRVHSMDMLQFNEVIGNVYEHPELLAVS